MAAPNLQPVNRDASIGPTIAAFARPATLGQDIRMPKCLCARKIRDLHHNDDHVRLVFRTKLSEVYKSSCLAIRS
jgi:hypothetical protein